MSTNVLELKNIHKDFGTFRALTDVNLNLEKGKIYGFIGKNGAGKTTLMRIISGMSLPTSGSMALFGKTEAGEICRERARLGVMLEDRGISPDLTAAQNLKAQMLLKGLHDDFLIREMLEIVGLTNTGSKKFKEFSLGMKRRLTLAATLLSKPEFLILDEPTNGLDPVGIKDIRDLLLRINREHGTTILISSHILRELYEIATDFIFIDSGEIIREISKEPLNKRLESKTIIRSREMGKVLDALRKHGLDAELTVNGDTITLSGNGFTEEELGVILHESEAVLLEFTQRRETLESYFISLIGGNSHA
ncbi:MAG: ABC transporter ATP-binding protein [Lachnospiraceae bacterium]|jgi:ABC-2 type transport system ATP-binding protein|nr:ABC transporter ATP-binding protein [Eubacteriales bacterium]